MRMTRILAFMGSPRFGGNIDTFLKEMVASAEVHGAQVEKINLYGIDMTPCLECGGCDETGVCILNDHMRPLYKKIEEADAIVVASPIFFYNISSGTQALVERSQALWVRKYVLKSVAGKGERRGIFVSLGATRGKRLFDGALMVMKYFFDAIDCHFERAFLYRGIEKKEEIKDRPEVLREARELGKRLAMREDLSDIGVDTP